MSPERRLKQLPFQSINVRPFVELRQLYVQYSIDELGGSSMTRLGRSPGRTVNGHLFARSVRFAKSVLRNCAECGGGMAAYEVDS